MYKIPKLDELSFLVYGLGLSGISVVKFFKRKKIKHFKVWDDKKKNLLKKYRTKNLKKSLDQVDYIVLAPGISILNNKSLIKYKNKIITDIDLFFLTKNSCKSIVVTGTNGKSTTCKLLTHFLKKNKKIVSVGGNIGTPILDLKTSKNDFVIIEASSFQLSHSKFIFPDYALFLNLTNDHLDWHMKKINYLNAKLKIFALQKKYHYAIINKKLKKFFIKKKFLSKLIIPSNKNYERIKSKIDNKYLKSNVNDENLSFVYAFSKLLNINDRAFISSMKSFKGLPHRFEFFLKKKDILFVNDSKATSFTATNSALRSLRNVYLIIGGIPKKGDKIDFSIYKKNIIKCYIIGKHINFFKKQIKGKINYSICKELKNSVIQIFKDIKLLKNSNKTILLSPAAASFDQFDNFEKRGEEFKRLCKQYARKLI